jgi:hypothetical protein
MSKLNIVVIKHSVFQDKAKLEVLLMALIDRGVECVIVRSRHEAMGTDFSGPVVIGSGPVVIGYGPSFGYGPSLRGPSNGNRPV